MEEKDIDSVVAAFREIGAKLGPMPGLKELRAAADKLYDALEIPTGVTFQEEFSRPGLWTYGPAGAQNGIVMYLHGGGFAMHSPKQYKTLTAELCLQSRADVFAVDYRRAPEAPYPAALDDAFAAYCWLLLTRPETPIAFAGDSAGGGLVLALMLRCKREGLPMPRAAFVISPWVDLTMGGRTIKSKGTVDPVVSADGLEVFASYYLAGHSATDPLVSPLFGDFTDFPPLLIHVGSEEVLLDDAVRLAGKAGEARVEVKLEVWANMIHEWHMWHSRLIEAELAIMSASTFLREHLE